MTDAQDMELVRQFARDNSEAAFTELVRRHINLVYSVARRCTGNDSDAHDVTQAVFITLARKAVTLRERTLLTGWLYETTRFTTTRLLRTNARRHVREQEAFTQSTLNEADNAEIWTQLAPHLEAAMDRLAARDRALLVLRFYENKTAAETATLLGIREDAAQKRVTRAIEKLRKSFARRGITISGAAIAGAVSANSIQAAPAGLAAMISSTALSGTAITTAAVVAAAKAIAMTTFQKAIVSAALVATVSAGIFEAHQNSQLREQNQTLQQKQTSLAEQNEQLQHERNNTANRLASLADEMERAKGNSIELELLKLRGEVSRLSVDSQELARLKSAAAQAANDPAESASKDLVAKVNLLKQRLDQRPQTKIPELQYLNGQDWLRLAQDARLRDDNPSDDQVLWALSTVRSAAKQQFAYLTCQALIAYEQANGGQLPSGVSQLTSYFNSPVDDATLQRYQVIKTGNVSDLQPGEMIISEKAPVDNQYDTLWQIGLTNFQWQGTGKNTKSFQKGSWAFKAP